MFMLMWKLFDGVCVFSFCRWMPVVCVSSTLVGLLPVLVVAVSVVSVVGGSVLGIELGEDGAEDMGVAGFEAAQGGFGGATMATGGFDHEHGIADHRGDQWGIGEAKHWRAVEDDDVEIAFELNKDVGHALIAEQFGGTRWDWAGSDERQIGKVGGLQHRGDCSVRGQQVGQAAVVGYAERAMLGGATQVDIDQHHPLAKLG